ncbi:B-box zinc finger family protein [Melia azedarach]|uniref:B-box zinc finger family protein n=1 Tax=Melia azedarach TaxID=155640 RepID=A0ACC1XT18_MELAZ|nr:B-box zinc finger family protein [Melia azedarach]
MRVICDFCEGAAAVVFCPDYKIALCGSCDLAAHDGKVCSHMRLSLVDNGKYPLCEICDRAQAFFHCEKDCISLCINCDALVHNGARKRAHSRFLVLRQQALRTDVACAQNFPPPEPETKAESREGTSQPPLKLEEEVNSEEQNLCVPRVPVAKPKRNGRMRCSPMVGTRRRNDRKRKHGSWPDFV